MVRRTARNATFDIDCVRRPATRYAICARRQCGRTSGGGHRVRFSKQLCGDCVASGGSRCPGERRLASLRRDGRGHALQHDRDIMVLSIVFNDQGRSITFLPCPPVFGLGVRPYLCTSQLGHTLPGSGGRLATAFCGSKRLFVRRKYFLIQFEGPKQGPKRSEFLRTSLHAPGSKARDH